MSDNLKTISFDEIVKGRDSTVRVIEGKLPVVDISMAMTGKDRNQAAEVIRRLPEELFPQSKMLYVDSGNQRIKVVTFSDAIQLVMVLPGRMAKEIRVQFADIIRRYMAGDVSMHAELESNAQSTSPIAQMARGSLASEQAVDERSLQHKRMREELEYEERMTAVQERRLQNIRSTLDILSLTAINQNSPIDDRTKLQMQDLAKNILFNGTAAQLAITNGPDHASGASPFQISEHNPIDFQIVSRDLQYDCSLEDAKNLGRLMAETYRSVHKKNPPQHMQYVNGKTIPVNSYMEKDRKMMEQVITEYNAVKVVSKQKSKQAKAGAAPGQTTISFPVGTTLVVASSNE